MNWFKNLNATPRLLLSFGVLIVLIGVISYLAIANLGQANDRLQVLYQEDMMGAIQSANISVARMSLGRQARDAMLNIADPAGRCFRQKHNAGGFRHHPLEPRRTGKIFLYQGGSS